MITLILIEEPRPAHICIKNINVNWCSDMPYMSGKAAFAQRKTKKLWFYISLTKIITQIYRDLFL